MAGHIDDLRVDETLAVGIDDDNDGGDDDHDNDDDGDDDGDDDDDVDDVDGDFPDLMPDSDYEEGDEEFEDNTNSIHDAPLDQPLYSVFRSHVLHIREVNQTLMKFNNGVLPISN